MILAAEPSFGIALLVVFIGFLLVAKLVRRSSCSGTRRCGWGKALLLLAIVGALFAYRLSRENPRHVASNQAEAAREMVEQMRLKLEQIKLQAIEEQRQAQDAKEKAADQAIESSSMTQLWEQLNRPRINLAADGQSASMSFGEGANRVELRTDKDAGARLSTPLSDKTPESLARSLARLERMVEQVSAVADQLSDAGTLIGKGMIALNDSIDSRRQPAPARVATPAPPSLAVKAVVAETVKKADVVNKVAESAAASEPVIGTSADADAAVAATTGPRPDWTRTAPERVGNTWREVVVTEEYASADECARAADVYLLLTTYEHFRQLCGMPHSDASLPSLTFSSKNPGVIAADGRVIFEEHGTSGVWMDHRIRMLDQMGIGIETIRREAVPKEGDYLETVERSFGKMHKLYTMLEFTPSFDAELLRRWDEVRRQDRFAVVGVGAGSILGLITLVFGLLKVDTWTKGYYTKRLFLGVPAAIIGLVALLSFAAG